MSLPEFYDQLAEIALGWLGWSEEQTLTADVNAIVVGYEGRLDMLKAVFGSGEDAETPDRPKVASRPMSPELFDAIFP